jgi:hypothetical protein
MCAPKQRVLGLRVHVEHFLDTLFLPIELEADFESRTATANIPGVLTSRCRPLINKFSGEPFHVALARPSGSIEFTYADLALGTTTVSGEMDMAFSNSYAMFCVHHFNQDGMVRTK